MKPSPYSTLEGEDAGWVNRRVTRFLQTVDGGDVRMVQRGQDLGLTLEAGQAVGVISKHVRQDLQRHVPVQLGVTGAIDLAHAARSDEGGHFVRAEAGTGAEGHIGYDNGGLFYRGLQFNENHLMWNVGAGVKVFLTRNIFLRPQFRWFAGKYVLGVPRASLALGYHW